MNRRLRIVLALSTLLLRCSPAPCGCAEPRALPLGTSVPGPSAPPVDDAGAAPDSEPRAAASPLIWQFRVSSPLLAPAALSGESEVLVGTTDGHLHRLRSDGSFRWSTTLRGAVRAPAVVGAGGIAFVATNADRVYALRADGSLAWVFPAAFGVASDLVLGPHGHLYFMGKDHHLYGLSQRGGVVRRVRVGEPSAGPIAGESSIWIGTRSGELVRTSGLETKRFSCGTAPLDAVAKGAGAVVYALHDAQLLGLNWQTSAPFEAGPALTGARQLIAAPAGPVVISERNEALWLDGEARIARRLMLTEAPSASPLAHPDGRLLVPTQAGAVLIADPVAGTIRRVVVGTSPLLDLVWDGRNGRVIAAAQEGLVAAVSPDP